MRKWASDLVLIGAVALGFAAVLVFQCQAKARLSFQQRLQVLAPAAPLREMSASILANVSIICQARNTILPPRFTAGMESAGFAPKRRRGRLVGADQAFKSRA